MEAGEDIGRKTSQPASAVPHLKINEICLCHLNKIHSVVYMPYEAVKADKCECVAFAVVSALIGAMCLVREVSV